MSKYTTEVRFLCETYAGYTESQDYSMVDSIISQAAPKIFDTYPLFNESYRSVLNAKILKHYYTREIGEETVGLWKLRLNTRLSEIMPYYNKLYEWESMKFNPFYDVDITRDHTGEGTHDETRDRGETSKNTTEQTSNNTSHTQNVSDIGSKTQGSGTSEETTESTRNLSKMNKNKFSDTPQGSIIGVDTERYLTDYREIEDTENESINGLQTGKTTDSTETTGNTKAVEDQTLNGTFSQGVEGERTENENRNLNTTDKWLEHVFGKQGTQSYTSLWVEYRNALINIDMMIITELADLFMNVW